MSIPDELRNIRDHLRSGRFGQREVWERQLEKGAVEIERLLAAHEEILELWRKGLMTQIGEVARRALENKL